MKRSFQSDNVRLQEEARSPSILMFKRVMEGFDNAGLKIRVIERGYSASAPQSQSAYSRSSGYGSYGGSAPTGYGSQPPAGGVGSSAVSPTRGYGAGASFVPPVGGPPQAPPAHTHPPPNVDGGPTPPGGPGPMSSVPGGDGYEGPPMGGGRGGFQGGPGGYDQRSHVGNGNQGPGSGGISKEMALILKILKYIKKLKNEQSNRRPIEESRQRNISLNFPIEGEMVVIPVICDCGKVLKIKLPRKHVVRQNC